MVKGEIASGVAHEVPSDLKKILVSDSHLLEKWNQLTPLGRNEWICWVTIVKKPKTREEHITRLRKDILHGGKRPCCWPGCPHRREGSRKWFKTFQKENVRM